MGGQNFVIVISLAVRLFELNELNLPRHAVGGRRFWFVARMTLCFLLLFRVASPNLVLSLFLCGLLLTGSRFITLGILLHTLSRHFLVIVLFICSLPGAAAVICNFCHGGVPECAGDLTCPYATVPVVNTAIIGSEAGQHVRPAEGDDDVDVTTTALIVATPAPADEILAPRYRRWTATFAALGPGRVRV